MSKNDLKTRNRVCILTLNFNEYKANNINNVSFCRNAKKISGVEFLVGFETEFILINNKNPVEAVNCHGWCDAQALASGTNEAKVLEEIADALGIADVELQMYHSEAAPGQYEVVTGPLLPLEAADALIHTRETIYNIASKHGLRATLAPRVFLDHSMSLSFELCITIQLLVTNSPRWQRDTRAHFGSCTTTDAWRLGSFKSERNRSIFLGRCA